MLQFECSSNTVFELLGDAQLSLLYLTNNSRYWSCLKFILFGAALKTVCVWMCVIAAHMHVHISGCTCVLYFCIKFSQAHKILKKTDRKSKFTGIDESVCLHVICLQCGACAPRAFPVTIPPVTWIGTCLKPPSAALMSDSTHVRIMYRRGMRLITFSQVLYWSTSLRYLSPFFSCRFLVLCTTWQL